MSGRLQENKKKRAEPWKNLAIWLMVADFISMHIAFFLALWIRFDCVYSAIPKN